MITCKVGLISGGGGGGGGGNTYIFPLMKGGTVVKNSAFAERNDTIDRQGLFDRV